MREVLGTGGISVVAGALAFYAFWQMGGRAFFRHWQLGRQLRSYGLGRRA